MEENGRGFIFQFTNNWRYKDFSLGINFTSSQYNDLREYYLSLHLTFWQLFIGVRI